MVSLVEQVLLTLPGHLSSTPVFSGVRVTRSLILCVCFVDRCLPFCAFSFGHCVVCSSSICRSDCYFGIFKLFLNTSSWLNLYINVDRIVTREDRIVEKSTRDHDCVPAMHRGQVRVTPGYDYDKGTYIWLFFYTDMT